MSQVVPGILVGDGVYFFRGTGLPTAQTSQPFLTCAIGSLYVNLSGPPGGILFVCTVAPTPPNAAWGTSGTPGTWSAIA
jgi:hypothetical protein